MFLPHLSLAVTETSYRCCCRRPVWKLCEISESETGTRRSCHPFSGTRPHSSSTASDLRLCTHLGERKTSEVGTFTLLGGSNKDALCQGEQLLPQGAVLQHTALQGPETGEGTRQRRGRSGHLQLSSSKEQVWESRGK